MNKGAIRVIPTLSCLAISGLLLKAPEAHGEAKLAINGVSVSSLFFAPSRGDKVEIRFEVTNSGTATVDVVDRDGFLVRRLVTDLAVEPEKVAVQWDGRDDMGQVVPDEAYSLRIQARRGRETASYFPANSKVEEFGIKPDYYDRNQGILTYTLLKPSRVFIQAGVAKVRPNAKIKKLPSKQMKFFPAESCRNCHKGGVRGPVLRTVVDRVPRAAGRVNDFWDGYDDTGKLYIPDLEDFKVSIECCSLPQNSIITVGNKERAFLPYALERKGSSLLDARNGPAHHEGLSTLQDTSLVIALEPQNAHWSAADEAWIPEKEAADLKIRCRLQGPTAAAFAQLGGTAAVFADLEIIQQIAKPMPSFDLQIPLKDIPTGAHVIAVNWVNGRGPAAIGAIRTKVEKEVGTKGDLPNVGK